MKNTNENGRSMVEMLGVLAIIGVLSIGGIAGYTLAMNRYRANEAFDAVSKLAIVAMSADAGNGATKNLNNSDLKMNVATISSDTLAYGNNGVVILKFNAGTSENIKKLVQEMAGDRIVSSNKEVDCPTTSVDASDCIINMQKGR